MELGGLVPNEPEVSNELSLKVVQPQVGQRHEDVERKLESYHIIVFFKEWT